MVVCAMTLDLEVLFSLRSLINLEASSTKGAFVGDSCFIINIFANNTLMLLTLIPGIQYLL